MTKFNDLGRTVAAIACTALFSGACLLGAVAPAQPGAAHAAVSAVARVA